MSQAQKDYQAMIKAYLSKQLSEPELAEFEVQLLEDQDLFREVQRMEAMQDHLQSHSGRLFIEDNHADSKPGWLQSWLQWIAQPQSVFACLLLLAAFLLPVLQQAGDTSPAGSANLEGIASSITLQTLRGNDSGFSVTATPPVLLTIDVGPAAAASYGIEILDTETGASVLRQSGLVLDNEGWLRIILHEEISGAHRITITSADAQYQNSFTVNFIPAD